MNSCVTARKVNLLQEPGKHHIPKYADTLDYQDYRLRVGDRVYIYIHSVDENVNKLYNQGRNSQQIRQNINNTYSSNDLYTYLVDEDGNIRFPTIGNLYVRDLTTREVRKLLEQQLSDQLTKIGDYQLISAEVLIVQRTFSVIGAVKSALVAIPKEKVTIYEAIAMAGDVGDFGDRSKVRIVRERDGKTSIETFDLRSKDIINSKYYYIEPNDVIYIQRMPGHSFGINSAATAVSVTATTLSFGGFIYAIVVRTINAVNKSKQ